MKTNLIFVCLFLAACQSAPPVLRPLPDPLPLHARPNSIAAAKVGGETPAATTNAEKPSDTEKLTRQRQWIEALLAQNDALNARLESSKHDTASAVPPPAPAKSEAAAQPQKQEVSPPPAPAVPATTAAPPAVNAVAPPAPEPAAAPAPLLVPNANGVIDTTALNSGGNPPNPFAVRTLSPDAVREVTFVVDGIFEGGSPCALINGRVAEVGDLVESLRLTRITPTALVLSGDGFAINLPLGSTKVRLAL